MTLTESGHAIYSYRVRQHLRLTMDSKKMWRQRWLDSISELTSLELQQNSWLDPQNRSPHWSFVEFMCCYFDDLLGDHDYQHYIDKEWVMKDEYAAIKEWHTWLKGYEPPKGDPYDHKVILDDKKWQEITAYGEQAKKKLTWLLPTEEKEILDGKNVA